MKQRHLSSLVIVLLVIVSTFRNPQPVAALNPLSISFIDVGQGDSILISDPNGFDILIDGGTTTAGPIVVNYLRSKGVDDVDVMVATHPDADHIGGLINVLNMTDIPVQQVLYSGYPGTTATWTNFVNAVTNEGLTLTTAQYPSSYTWGNTTADVLNPVAGLSNPETNAASIVIRLEYGSLDFLFTGDISSTEEADILARGSNVTSNILKVAHHGSNYSSSTPFLEAVGMSDAVISVGPNTYGHPAPETLTRLLTAGAHIWRTDQNGLILVSSDGSNFSITPSIVGKRLHPIKINNVAIL